MVKPSDILSGNFVNSILFYTFAEYGIDNFGETFLEKYWDYTKNIDVDPWKLSYKSRTKVYIYCNKIDYHGSYKVSCNHFSSSRSGSGCSFCKGDHLVHPKDSFGQFLIDSYGTNALELYWDYDKNTVDPFKITRKSNKKVWIKCQKKEYHESYDITCSDFARGGRCGYCYGGRKVHIKDSLGYLYPKSLEVWSDKNTKTPFECLPSSARYVWCKCDINKHEDHYGTIYNLRMAEFRCPSCSNEQKDSRMATTLKQVLKHEYPQTKWEYDAGFKIKDSISRFDIYVPELDKLLVECQSEYHDSQKMILTDSLKKQFALSNEYRYLAIDKRDLTILEALQLFIPKMDKIPDYVSITKGTSKDWDSIEAQKLLNEGHNYAEVANLLDTTPIAIRRAIGAKVLIKPDNYQRQKIGRRPVVCLSKNNELVKIYGSAQASAEDLNGSSACISECLTKKPRSGGTIRKTAYGFKWMYLDDYENMIKELEKL